MFSPVATRGQYGDLFGLAQLPVLEELFRAEMSMHPSRRPELFKIVNTDRDIWQATEIHDLDLLTEVPEGSEYSFKRPKQGSSKTLQVVKFGLGFSISEEMIEDGRFDQLGDMVRKLARSAKESQEIQAMAVLNNGFTTELAADGLSVFNSAHLLPSGATFRNRLATNADLSVSSLEQALSDFETQFIGDSGIIYNLKARNLVVHPNSKRYAMELIGSDLKADTSDNNMNSIRQDGLKVISSPHLSDADAWFLTADPVDTGLRIVQRSAIETKADVVGGFATDAIRYKCRYREKIGVTHPYGVFGSPGA